MMTFKRILSASLIGFSLIASNSVLAGGPDLSATPSWTGFYFGTNGGWGWSSSSTTLVPFGLAAIQDIPGQSLDNNLNGALFGVQAGYVHQWSRFVWGTDVSVDGADITNTETVISRSIEAKNAGFVGTNNFTAAQTVQLLASVRERFGVTLQSALCYLAAGVGFEQFYEKDTLVGNVGRGNWNSSISKGFTNFNVGYVVGAGFDYPIAQHWTVGSEYLLYGFPSATHHQMVFLDSAPAGAGVTIKTKNSIVNVAQLNVAYKF